MICCVVLRILVQMVSQRIYTIQPYIYLMYNRPQNSCQTMINNMYKLVENQGQFQLAM